MSAEPSELFWKHLALWLLECEAATAEHCNSTKSVSKGDRRRHQFICAQAVQMIRTNTLTINARNDRGTAIDRAQCAVNPQEGR